MTRKHKSARADYFTSYVASFKATGNAHEKAERAARRARKLIAKGGPFNATHPKPRKGK